MELGFIFQITLIVSITGLFTSFLLFLAVRTIPKVNSGVGWFALAAIAAIVAYIPLAIYPQSGSLLLSEAINTFCVIVWTICIYFGLAEFNQRKIYRQRIILFATLVFVATMYFYFIKPHFLTAGIIFSVFCSLLLLHLVYLLRRNHIKNTRFDNALHITLFVTALHFLDYSFLVPHKTYAIFGFLIFSMLLICIHSLLAFIIIEMFRLRMIESEKMALELAAIDPLTNVANRTGLNSQFKLALENAQREQHAIALFFIDLDHFKSINDDYGHDTGDTVLEISAQRMKALIRPTDILARIGGDEFVALLTGIKLQNIEMTHKFSDQLISSLQQPMSAKGTMVTVGASIGVAYYPSQATTLNALIKLADQAMYKAKGNR